MSTANIANEFGVEPKSIDLILEELKLLKFPRVVENDTCSEASGEGPVKPSGSSSKRPLSTSFVSLIFNYCYLLAGCSTQTGSSVPVLQDAAQIGTKRPCPEADLHSTQSASKRYCSAAQEQQLAPLLPEPRSTAPRTPS